MNTLQNSLITSASKMIYAES